MPYTPEYLELWQSLDFANNDKKRLYSYQSFQGRDRKRQTDELFWRNSNELGIDLSGMGFVIDNSTGELTLVFDGTGDNPVEIFKWLTFTDGTNSIDAASGGDVFTFEGLNDATVTVDPTTKKVSIDVLAGGLQNLIETITADGPDSFTASTPTDSLAVTGANGVVTKITASTLQITGPMSHRVFTGDTGSYSASTANATFNIVGGTDIDTTVSGNTVTIDFAGAAATSLWTEDATNNYLYPSTIGRLVGINTATPTDQLTVHGNVLFTQTDLTTDTPLLRFEHIGSEFTTFGTEPGTDVFEITNQYTSMRFNKQGNFYINNAATFVSNYALNIKLNNALPIHDPFTTGPIGGVYIETDDASVVPQNMFVLENTNSANSDDFVFRVTGDGGVENTGMKTGRTPLIESVAGTTQAYLGIDGNGVHKRIYQTSGANGSVLNVSGEKTITHNLGVVPSVVIAVKQFEDGAPIHPQTFGETCEVLRGSFTTTTFDVRLCDRLGAPLSNLFRTVYYIALA